MNKNKGVGKGNGPGSRRTQFKKGQPGISPGRPKGATGAKADFRREMRRMEEIKLPDGRIERVNAWRVLWRRTFREAPKNARLLAIAVTQANRYEMQEQLSAEKQQRTRQRAELGYINLDDLPEEDIEYLAEKYDLFKN